MEDKMLKFPISFFKEEDFLAYEEKLYNQEPEEDLEEWEIEMKKSAGTYKESVVEEPKDHRTDLYILKKAIVSFHASFLLAKSNILDGTAVYTESGQMYVCTLPCEEFLKIYEA